MIFDLTSSLIVFLEIVSYVVYVCTIYNTAIYKDSEKFLTEYKLAPKCILVFNFPKNMFCNIPFVKLFFNFLLLFLDLQHYLDKNQY